MSIIIWPDSGDMQRQVTIKLWSDVPNAAFGLDQTFDAGLQRWAKVEPIVGVAYWGSKQAGEDATHRFWVRYGEGTKPEQVTGQHVIEWAGRRYRVIRSINVGDAQRFTAIECKDLGAIV